jgi:hypothetical protein
MARSTLKFQSVRFERVNKIRISRDSIINMKAHLYPFVEKPVLTYGDENIFMHLEESLRVCYCEELNSVDEKESLVNIVILLVYSSWPRNTLRNPVLLSKIKMTGINTPKF